MLLGRLIEPGLPWWAYPVLALIAFGAFVYPVYTNYRLARYGDGEDEDGVEAGRRLPGKPEDMPEEREDGSPSVSGSSRRSRRRHPWRASH